MPRSGQKILRRFVKWTTLLSASNASLFWSLRTRTERFWGERLFIAWRTAFFGCCRIQSISSAGDLQPQRASSLSIQRNGFAACFKMATDRGVAMSLLADVELTRGTQVSESCCFVAEIFEQQTEIVMSIG